MTHEPSPLVLSEFLTEAQITEAAALHAAHGHWDAVVLIQVQIIEPNMEAIVNRLSQKNSVAIDEVLKRAARDPGVRCAHMFYLANTVVYELWRTKEEVQ
jgi:hypothetical protein